MFQRLGVGPLATVKRIKTFEPIRDSKNEYGGKRKEELDFTRKRKGKKREPKEPF